VLLFGRSLGGAVTIDIAREEDAGAVIVESTFLSVPDVAQGIYPILPVRWFVLDKFHSKEKIAEVKSPLLKFHSAEDEIIPYAHGEELFSLAPEPKASAPAA